MIRFSVKDPRGIKDCSSNSNLHRIQTWPQQIERDKRAKIGSEELSSNSMLHLKQTRISERERVGQLARGNAMPSAGRSSVMPSGTSANCTKVSAMVKTSPALNLVWSQRLFLKRRFMITGSAKM
jgi:hypothetical protein